jgi:hypothetical protein
MLNVNAARSFRLCNPCLNAPLGTWSVHVVRILDVLVAHACCLLLLCACRWHLIGSEDDRMMEGRSVSVACLQLKLVSQGKLRERAPSCAIGQHLDMLQLAWP